MIFLISGFTSTYLVYLFKDEGGFIFPGLLFSSATVLVFLLTNKNVRSTYLIKSYLLINLTCLTLWVLTFISLYLRLLTGIEAGGLGASITFQLTNKYIAEMKYKKTLLFILGGIFLWQKYLRAIQLDNGQKSF